MRNYKIISKIREIIFKNQCNTVSQVSVALFIYLGQIVMYSINLQKIFFTIKWGKNKWKQL